MMESRGVAIRACRLPWGSQPLASHDAVKAQGSLAWRRESSWVLLQGRRSLNIVGRRHRGLVGLGVGEPVCIQNTCLYQFESEKRVKQTASGGLETQAG